MVYVSDGINLSLQIKQSRRTIEGAPSRATFHLEDKEGTLRLYLPKDEIDRDVCFESDLPRKLCKYLNIGDPSALALIGGVFRRDKIAVIDKILELAGVGEVEYDFATLDNELGILENDSDNETLVEPSRNSGHSTPLPRSQTRTLSARAIQSGLHSRGLSGETIHNQAPLQNLHREEQEESQKLAYKSILENALNVARKRVGSGVLECMSVSTNGAGAIRLLPQETFRKAFPDGNLDRLHKTGAAGELYMYEFLKGLDLPDFDLGCWTSCIRDRVNILASYRDLEKDNGRKAIADIEYKDASSKLTHFLIGKGHLAAHLWAGQKPFYHIEVKTTVSSSWQEPFFMSRAQERHVRHSISLTCCY